MKRKKETMIKELLEDDIRSLQDNDNHWEWFELIMLEGFVGYNSQSYTEICMEFNERFQE